MNTQENRYTDSPSNADIEFLFVVTHVKRLFPILFDLTLSLFLLDTVVANIKSCLVPLDAQYNPGTLESLVEEGWNGDLIFVNHSRFVF